MKINAIRFGLARKRSNLITFPYAISYRYRNVFESYWMEFGWEWDHRSRRTVHIPRRFRGPALMLDCVRPEYTIGTGSSTHESWLLFRSFVFGKIYDFHKFHHWNVRRKIARRSDFDNAKETFSSRDESYSLHRKIFADKVNTRSSSFFLSFYSCSTVIRSESHGTLFCWPRV